MIPFENPVCIDSSSIVDAILNNSPNAKKLLHDKYGSGLLFLIKRHCCEHAEQFYAHVSNATIDAVLRREVSADKDLPRLIRSIFRRLLPKYEEDLAAHQARLLDEIGRTDWKAINKVRQELSVFGPIHLQALARFYVNGEAFRAICADLGLSEELFSETRKLARQIVRLAFDNLQAPHERASKVFKTEFKARKVAG